MSAFRQPQLARTNRLFLMIGLLGLLALAVYFYWDYQQQESRRAGLEAGAGTMGVERQEGEAMR